MHTVVRQIEINGAPQIRIPAKRVKDFERAAHAFCKTRDLKQLYRKVVEIIIRQFAAENAWVALRTGAEGPMECQGGRKITSETVMLTELAGHQGATDAMENGKYILIPQLPRQMTGQTARSAIIAPIMRNGQCYGLLYADNSMKHERYGLADLDYLMFLSIHIAAVLETF